jgi:hypothetical protein
VEAVAKGHEVLVEKAAVQDSTCSVRNIAVGAVEIPAMGRSSYLAVLSIIGKAGRRLDPIASCFLIKDEVDCLAL